jgi:hypothetical protein
LKSPIVANSDEFFPVHAQSSFSFQGAVGQFPLMRPAQEHSAPEGQSVSEIHFFGHLAKKAEFSKTNFFNSIGSHRPLDF